MLVRRHVFLLTAFMFAPSALLAHGSGTGPRGGQLQHAGDLHLELQLEPDGTVSIHVYDANDKPVAVQGFRGQAVLLIGGKAQTVPLAPTGPNTLSGRGPVADAKTTRTVVTLQLGTDKSVQARFAPTP